MAMIAGNVGSRPEVATGPRLSTVAELLEHLGGIPADRVRLQPSPGTATVDDLINADRISENPCELIDGTLVNKTMGYLESEIACLIIAALSNFVVPRSLGIVLGEAGTLRLLPNQVRIPDVCFISRERFPEGKRPDHPVPSLVPDLAVEVLSQGNTNAEMARKLQEYFQAGTRLVWYVDPKARTVSVYHEAAENPARILHPGDTLDGGAVLPGFEHPVDQIFPRVAF